MSCADPYELLQQIIKQLPVAAQRALHKEILDDQDDKISYADALITLSLVIKKAEVRGLQPCHLAWQNIAAAVALLAALDRPRLEARARCGFSHREFYWALECDMYGVSTGGVTGSRRFARCLPCAIGKPGKCGASSAAWFCRRRLAMLDTCSLHPSEKANAIRLHGITLMPSRSHGHELARGLGEDGLLQPPSRKTVTPPPTPEDDGLLSLFDRGTWSSNSDTNDYTVTGGSICEKKPETFVSQARLLFETMQGLSRDEMWKEVTFACTKRYVGCLKRLAGKESFRRKAQEAALAALGRTPAPLRRVDLQATQLKRWPDYDFIMGLPETDMILSDEAREASACFLNSTTHTAIAEMQPPCFGLPPWHQHPDPEHPGRYLGRQRPFPHNAAALQSMGERVHGKDDSTSAGQKPSKQIRRRSTQSNRPSSRVVQRRSAPTSAAATQAVSVGEGVPALYWSPSQCCAATLPDQAAKQPSLKALRDFPQGLFSRSLQHDRSSMCSADLLTMERSQHSSPAILPAHNDSSGWQPNKAPTDRSTHDDAGFGQQQLPVTSTTADRARGRPESSLPWAAAGDVGQGSPQQEGMQGNEGHVDYLAPLFTAGHPSTAAYHSHPDGLAVNRDAACSITGNQQDQPYQLLSPRIHSDLTVSHGSRQAVATGASALATLSCPDIAHFQSGAGPFGADPALQQHYGTPVQQQFAEQHHQVSHLQQHQHQQPHQQQQSPDPKVEMIQANWGMPPELACDNTNSFHSPNISKDPTMQSAVSASRPVYQRVQSLPPKHKHEACSNSSQPGAIGQSRSLPLPAALHHSPHIDPDVLQQCLPEAPLPQRHLLESEKPQLPQQPQQQLLQGRTKRGRAVTHERERFLGAPPPRPAAVEPASMHHSWQTSDVHDSCNTAATASVEQAPEFPSSEKDDFQRVWRAISAKPADTTRARDPLWPHTASHLNDAASIPSRVVETVSPTAAAAFAVDGSIRSLHKLPSIREGGSGLSLSALGKLPASSQASAEDPAKQLADDAAAHAIEAIHADTALSMPPLLCATLSDLNFNLDGALWDSENGIFRCPSIGGASGGDEATLTFAQKMHRLSSGFSDWKLLEPPTKKQQ